MATLAARRRSSIRGCARDLLLAAALLHDVGRTLELGRGPGFALTDEGRLLGHVHLGLRLIEERAEGLTAAPARGAPALRRVAPRRARGANGRGGRALPREPARRGRSDAQGRLTPLLLALGASLAWGVADFVGPLLSRTLGVAPDHVLGRRSAGSPAIAIVVAIRGEGPAGWGVLFAVAAAIGGTLGLFAYYRGMQIGAMSVVAPIAGASAVIPVVFGIATGDDPSRSQLVGIGLRARRRRARVARAPGGLAPRRRRASGLALLAALGFGFYFPWMHAAGKVDFWWASLIFRTTALLLVASAVAAARPNLRLSRRHARDRARRRARRHARQPALRRLVERAASSA